ncbi:MAG: acyl carrier protein [Actinomycetota bacterium]|nr:acyl carrier protein [Actinomycetota bacterium]
MTTLARLDEVIREVFDDPDMVLTDATTARDVPGWDSLAHVNLMFSIESEFGIAFSSAELSRLQDVGELRRVVVAKAGA